jgi:hypothetical protein
MRQLGLLLALLVAAGAGLTWYAGRGGLGEHQDAGSIAGQALPAEVLAARETARPVVDDKQVLFGDFHVHTTFSYDAFMQSLPLVGGSGAHPPADACDFARYCAGLDFWSINDHAEQLTPAHWNEAIASVRECNASADPAAPDLVSFLGWEWTQMGTTPDNHFGHKNVVLRDLGEGQVPTRPIANRTIAGGLNRPTVMSRGWDALRREEPIYSDFARFVTEIEQMTPCPDGVPVRDLPADCSESVSSPGELFARLDDWGFPAIVIPHGTTWGIYTPPGASWRKQLHTTDPSKEFIWELYSGHGNTEEYVDNAAVMYNAEGNPYCPPPTASYLPSCWRAGEIIEGRCLAAGLQEDECALRAARARQYYVEGASGGHLSIPDAAPGEWLDSGQCRDCFLPAFNYRRDSSAQAALAMRESAGTKDERRFRFGFIGSSDNHSARPGTGYKEFAIGEMSDGSRGGQSAYFESADGTGEPLLEAQPVTLESFAAAGARAFEVQRVIPFLYTGGLVAVHSAGRSREAIWEALQRREVYATSGPRILLWFSADSGGRAVAMGGELAAGDSPSFTVRALGSRVQKPGCPDHAVAGLGEARLRQLCLGECDNPGDARRAISRIEIVRIRPQLAGEPLEQLIESPWRTFDCSEWPAGEGCEVSFTDPDFADAARDTVYYARAVEVPGQAVNADTLGCIEGDNGACEKTVPCTERPGAGPDCLGEVEERAWSSPIYVDFAAP